MFEEFMGTKPVSGKQQFHLGALSDYLKAHVPGYAGRVAADISAEQFKGGQSNPTFKLTVQGAGGPTHYVMRTKPGPAAKLLPSAHAIEREFRVQDALEKSGFPAAKMYTQCTDEAVIGRA